MATIAFDASSTGIKNSGFTVTQSHTCTGSDLILVVFVRINGSNSQITHVKYDGVTMTQSVALNPNISHTAFYLVNPSTGANNIVTTVDQDGSQVVVAGVSLTGADTSDPIDVTGSKNQSTSTISNSITTTVANTMVVSGAAQNATARTWTTEAGGTERTDTNGQTSSTKPLTSAGATTTGFTCSQSGTILLLQLAIKDVEQPVADTGNFFQLF